MSNVLSNALAKPIENLATEKRVVSIRVSGEKDSIVVCDFLMSRPSLDDMSKYPDLPSTQFRPDLRSAKYVINYSGGGSSLGPDVQHTMIHDEGLDILERAYCIACYSYEYDLYWAGLHKRIKES